MLYSDDQMVEMTLEIEAVADLLKAIEKILEEEKEGTNISAIGNVIYTDFGILAEFERLREARLKLPQVIAVYHDWAERTYMLCVKNRGRLQKGKLRRYIEQCFGQVLTIKKLFPK